MITTLASKLLKFPCCRLGVVRALNVASRPSDLVGNTPLLDLSFLLDDKAAPKAQLFGKLESLGPCSSVKDRIGKYMIDDAEEKGLITPGKSILVEPTRYVGSWYQNCVTISDIVQREYWHCTRIYRSRTRISVHFDYARNHVGGTEDDVAGSGL